MTNTPDPITTAREALTKLNTMAEGWVATVFGSVEQNAAWDKRDAARLSITAALDYAEKLKAERDGAEFLNDLSDEQVLAIHDASHKQMIARYGTPSRAIIAETQIADLTSQLEQAERVMSDIITHTDSWRDGLIIAKSHAEVMPPDIDDKAYWHHEITALDRELAAASQWIKDRQAKGDGEAS